MSKRNQNRDGKNPGTVEHSVVSSMVALAILDEQNPQNSFGTAKIPGQRSYLPSESEVAPSAFGPV